MMHDCDDGGRGQYARDWITDVIRMTKACEFAADTMVAFGRALDQAVRASEELLTVDQRFHYYALRDAGVAPFDAFEQIMESETQE
jgi:hypothetical protein